MWDSKKIRDKQFGFTLMETMVATAIMAILACLVIPAVITIQRNLYMAKLDDYARQIFMAAQNEMSSMKDSGRLDAFAKELANMNGRRLEQEPQDFPAESGVEAGSESWRDLFAVTSSDAVIQNYLIRADNSLQQATENNGVFWIELNPLSGDVYSVFYAEKDFIYTEVQALADRTRKTRTKPQLGYYGSESADFGTVGLAESFAPTVTIVNGEELYYTVNCNGMMALRRTQKYLTLTVMVTDEHGNTQEFSYQGGKDFYVVNDSITVTEVLDSLEDASAFAVKCKGLTPGDDITVTAKLTYKDHNNAVNIEGETAPAQDNSLFFNKSGDTIQVAKVRHLNNLRETKFNAANQDIPVTKVLQSNDISFEFSDWDSDDYCSPWTQNPLQSFQPISNDALFTNGGYNGQNQTLKAFVFAADAANNSALFSALDTTTLQNVRLTDCSANGGNAAALAASVANCTVTNCGIYLNTIDANGNYYADMNDHVEKYTITGTATAGGLVSVADQTTFTDCFGAINTTGSSNVGGLIGNARNCTIKNSYSSGEVGGSSNVGGLIGQSTATRIDTCYSTSVITSDNYGGGLVGVAQSGNITNCVSYGMVKDKNGAESATSGGIAGMGSGAVFSGCKYLKQAKYNGYADVQAGVDPTAYSALRDSVAHNGESYPYKAALRNLGMPFPLLKQTVAADGSAAPATDNMPHYGNWPEAYQLQNSLVYYEKYADGSYGYYARTSLTSGGESAGNNWVVDTLKSETCVEDGYALMTIYTLDHFVYDLDTGDTTTAQKKNQRVNISATVARENANLIAENVDLVFKDADAQTGNAETTISNAKVYRLPFDLQITSRLRATTFWETLVITGYSGNNVPVFENETFYYCPDFAKNAVNPEINVTPLRPSEPGGETHPVYVRSARQLNGLSRSKYYWNPAGGQDEKIYFVQETDINFGTYVTNYCGVTYNLMDTSADNIYRNEPIGRPNDKVNQDKLADNFRNCYDGQCHKIIDYCCDSNKYRFTGLFGEVERCIIKNVIMEASDPNQGKYGTGYVKSFYTANVNGQPVGVGALIGLVYMEKIDASPDQIDPKYRSTIENCAVSGYHVEYYGTDSAGAVVGGLVGFNFCEIKNCSAVSKKVYANETNTEARVGGLVGSLVGVGSIENCYAGGVLAAKGDAKVGGISGGFMVLYGYGQKSEYQRKQTITNSYSYCTIKSENFESKGYGGKPQHVFGVAVPWINENYGTPKTSLTVNNCYYLNDPEVMDMKVYAAFSDGSTALTITELVKATDKVNDSGNTPAERSFPWSGSLKGMNYPFPAFVKNADDEFVHYGDWPYVEPQDYGPGWNLTKTAYLTYYEQYEDGTIGAYTLGDDGKPLSTLSQDKKIVSSGYGFLQKKGEEFKIGVGENHDRYNNEWLNPIGKAVVEFFQPNYQLVAANEDVLTQMKTQSSGWWQKTVKVDLMDQNRNPFTTVYSDPSFAQAVYSNADPASLYLRTQDQLQASNGLSQNWTFTLTHDIEVTSANIGMLNNNAGASVYDGCYTDENGSQKYYRIIGLQQPLFNKNSGTVRNLTLEDVKIKLSGGDAAAIAVTNNTNAKIENCTVRGTITADSGRAAGMVVNNNGIISNSTVDATITAQSDAAGFVWQANDTITSCAAKVTVTSKNGKAAGFITNNNGSTITACKVEAASPADETDSTKAATDDRTNTTAQLAQITAQGDAAGFANSNTGTIKRCIAKVALASTNGAVAGFVNGASGGSISSCAVTGTISITQNATVITTAGFFTNGWAAIKDCFTTVKPLKEDTKMLYGFGSNPTNSNVQNCGYVTAGSSTETVATQYPVIDWSKALDENGVPSETNWPGKVTTSTQATSETASSAA